MPIKITKLCDEPIIVATFESPLDVRQDSPAMFQALIDLLPTVEGFSFYYVITDTTRSDRLGFGDIVFMLSESRVMMPYRREDTSVRLMLIGSGALMDLATKAMSQLQYGAYGMRLFTSLDNALMTARSELAVQNIKTA